MKIWINEKEIEVHDKKSVLDAAKDAGTYIPSLCNHPQLRAFGACRMCIVQIEGMRGFPTSCTTTIEDGFKIKTDTLEIQELRKNILELMLSEHPNACLFCSRKEECKDYQECIEKSSITTGCKFCPSNGKCELQDVVNHIGLKELTIPFHYRGLPIERNDPFFDRDYNLCILCGRCVRVCQEIRGAGTLAFINRGNETIVSTAFDRSHLLLNCQFCGACVDACPTGALSDRYSKWEAPAENCMTGCCPLCSIGCEIKLNISGNQITSAESNQNELCVRGRFGIGPLVNHPKRKTSPAIRKENYILEVNWDEAFAFAQTKLNEHKNKTGIIFSSHLSVEALDSLKQLNNSFMGSSSNYVRNIPYLDIDNLSERSAFIVLNTDLIDDFSVMLLKIKHKMKPVIIVIDPIKTKIAEKATLWLKPHVNKEIDVLNVLLNHAPETIRTGIGNKEIKKAKDLLANREIYCLFNPRNIKELALPDNVKPIPLASSINALKTSELTPLTDQDILANNELECLYIVGENPKLARQYKTIIVQDYFMPEFDFDLFLPAATFVETEGSFINIEGKKITWPKAVEPAGKAKPDEWIINEIAKRISPSNEPIKVPFAHRIPSKTHTTKPSRYYPFYLMVRENCYSFRSRQLSSLTTGFRRIRNDHALWINLEDASKLNLKEGSEVKVIGADLAQKMVVTITDKVPQGTLLTYHNPASGLMFDQCVKLEPQVTE